MTPRARAALAVGAVLGLQGLAYVSFTTIESWHEVRGGAGATALQAIAWTPESTPLPPLPLLRGTEPAEEHGGMQGRRVPPPAAPGSEERPLLLHFWASWCTPCREELPRFLALEGEVPADLLAVSVDDSWDAVKQFAGPTLGGGVPGPVWRMGRAEAAALLDVTSLPVTLVAEGGTVRARVEGSQWWTRERAEHLLRDVAR